MSVEQNHELEKTTPLAPNLLTEAQKKYEEETVELYLKNINESLRRSCQQDHLIIDVYRFMTNASDVEINKVCQAYLAVGWVSVRPIYEDGLIEKLEFNMN